MIEKQIDMFGSVTDNKLNKGLGKIIISASRRTDIPAFFYDWLQMVLAEGSVEIPNPMFPEKRYSVDLKPESVHSIVLWSKNFANVLKNPGQLSRYNLYFQYTINNYSRLLEPNVPEYGESIRTLDGLLKRFSPRQFNIRFDPVIISSKGEVCPTPDAPERARLKAFELLCGDLAALGMEKCRITTSYLEMYGHVRTRLNKTDLEIADLNDERQLILFEQMADIAEKHKLQLYSCASPLLQRINSIKKGQCVDGQFLEELFGGKVRKSKDKGQRVACGCSYSRDIGIYSRNENGMKCRHDCVYCYVRGNGT